MYFIAAHERSLCWCFVWYLILALSTQPCTFSPPRHLLKLWRQLGGVSFKQKPEVASQLHQRRAGVCLNGKPGWPVQGHLCKQRKEKLKGIKHNYDTVDIYDFLCIREKSLSCVWNNCLFLFLATLARGPEPSRWNLPWQATSYATPHMTQTHAQSNRGKPSKARGEHASRTQKGPGFKPRTYFFWGHRANHYAPRT